MHNKSPSTTRANLSKNPSHETNDLIIDAELMNHFYRFSCNVKINSEASYEMTKTTSHLLLRCCKKVQHEHEILLGLHNYLEKLIGSYELDMQRA